MEHLPVVKPRHIHGGATEEIERGTPKSQRPHDENTKRAYIAASRRTDRSEEARITSAHKASEIHKKLTGKSLRISRDIVLKDEMYEEEDDHISRSLQQLYPSLHAEQNMLKEEANSSEDSTSPLSLVQLNTIRQQAVVNRLFDQYFTNTNQQVKAVPTANTELGGNYERSSTTTTPSPKRKRLLEQTNESCDIIACKKESCNINYPSSNYAWVPDLDVPLYGVRKNPPAAVPNVANIDPQLPECPRDYASQSYSLTDDVNDVLRLNFASCSPSASSVACDDLYVQCGLSDGAMNDGMGAEDWMNLSDYYCSGDKV
ncbi:hypothetical protein VFPPC_11850 [Pochonia chlamydosporia 170]|uniref:Uncharacterized protein n=1 Tax=Pochonia chlamydosporia 170 TaxID=1380566 RepID=A0A179EYI2_METCM|nr:hypothetical protein VFPPC_11850 [Pochonia chlamydosporia 170]OAQ57959.1 hypothetical protein VFPPC_11850 [Pochonia chlamydosporia 170]